MSLAQSLLITTTQPYSTDTQIIDALLHFLSSFDERFTGLSATHPDVHCLTNPEEHIQIDDIRQLQHTIMNTGYQGSVQVFFLFAIEQASSAAHHALLKILEEPPTGVFFVLQTHRPYAILPTIRSRCTLLAWDNQETDPSEPDTAAVDQALTRLETGSVVTALQEAEVWKERDAAQTFVRACLWRLHTNLEHHPTPKLLTLVGATQETQRALEQNGNVRLCMEHLFLQFVT